MIRTNLLIILFASSFHSTENSEHIFLYKPSNNLNFLVLIKFSAQLTDPRPNSPINFHSFGAYYITPKTGEFEAFSSIEDLETKNYRANFSELLSPRINGKVATFELYKDPETGDSFYFSLELENTCHFYNPASFFKLPTSYELLIINNRSLEDIKKAFSEGPKTFEEFVGERPKPAETLPREHEEREQESRERVKNPIKKRTEERELEESMEDEGDGHDSLGEEGLDGDELGSELSEELDSEEEDEFGIDKIEEVEENRRIHVNINKNNSKNGNKNKKGNEKSDSEKRIVLISLMIVISLVLILVLSVFVLAGPQKKEEVIGVAGPKQELLQKEETNTEETIKDEKNEKEIVQETKKEKKKEKIVKEMVEEGKIEKKAIKEENETGKGK